MLLRSPRIYTKGVDFISKYKAQRFIKTVGLLVGVAFAAASFFILRNNRNDLAALNVRVRNLERDRLREAYKQAGYEFD